MKFEIIKENDILDLSHPAYSFYGSFTERELIDLKLTGLDAEILRECESPADYLLALETIYRKHEADKAKA